MNTVTKRIHRPGGRRYTNWTPSMKAKRPEISVEGTRMVNELIDMYSERGYQHTFTSMVEECIARAWEDARASE